MCPLGSRALIRMNILALFVFEASPLCAASSSAMGTSFPRFVFLETHRLLQHLFPAVASPLQGELVPFPEVTGNVRKRMHDVLENSLRWVAVRRATFWKLPRRLTSVFLESFYQLKNRERSLLSALIKTRIDPFYSSSQGQSCTDKYVVIIKQCPVHNFTKFFAPTLLSCLPVEMDESCTINSTND